MILLLLCVYVAGMLIRRENGRLAGYDRRKLGNGLMLAGSALMCLIQAYIGIVGVNPFAVVFAVISFMAARDAFRQLKP